MSITIVGGGNPSGPTFPVQRSVRLRSSASAYFNRTPASAGNAQKFTMSCWVKLGSVSQTSGQVTFLNAGDGTQTNTTNDAIQLRSSGTALQVQILGKGGTGGTYAQFSAYLRDYSSWYHIVVAVDTTQATQANRCKAYINGVEQTSYVANGFTLNYSFSYINSTSGHLIGRENEGAGPNYTDAYLTEMNFVDGQQLTPTSFGAYNNYGVWSPAKYTGTYGTNGFYLNFQDNSAATAAAIGKDSSGNGNNWTPNNISVTAGVTYDSMLDVPTNTSATNANFCTLNPLSNGNTISYANLRVVTATNTNTFGTIGVSSGKWYFEATITTAGGSFPFVGIAPSTLYLGSTATSWAGTSQSCWAGNGAFANGDVCGFAFDLDALTFTAYKNNVALSSAYYGNSTVGQNTITSGLTWVAAVSGVSSTIDLNFGQRPFSYTPPSGFKSLNTYNLPAPTIPNGAAYMAATTYTGNGTTTNLVNTVNGVSFQPDLVWQKNRSSIANNILVDSVRGGNLYLISNTTGADASAPGYMTFNSNGESFTSSDVATNQSGQTYISWQWKANGTPAVVNTSGSIPSTISANTTSGFSIVTWTSTGANATVGHGLGVAPKMVIVKGRSAVSQWFTWHTSLTSGAYALILNLTDAQTSYPTVFNSTTPTSTVFSVGTSLTASTTAVAYCFSEIAGYSKFGSYTGNGSADGPFVYLGFRPRWIMVKRTDSTSEWYLRDTSRDLYNVSTQALYANQSSAETTSSYLFDLNSNGFKLRSSGIETNASGGTYIFAAFAENPFNYSLAR